MNPTKLTQAEKIEILAKDLMGWESYNVCNMTCSYPEWRKDKKWIASSSWNPFTDENDGRQVIVKIADNHDLFTRWTTQIAMSIPHDIGHANAWMLLLTKATLEQRMNAIVEVLSSSKK